MRLSLLLCITALLCLRLPVHAQGTPESASQTADSRILSISTIVPLEPWPDTTDEYIVRYLASTEAAVRAGVRGDVATSTWRDLEPAPGEYALDDLIGAIVYPAQTYRHTLYIGIQMINTTDKETPDDLMEVAFDDPQMLTRFTALVRVLAARLQDEGLSEYVRYISLGNEVDGYLQATDQWQAFTTFYTQAAGVVRRELPGVQVGTTVGFGGAGEYREQVARLNTASDVFILTYYPLNPDFSVRPPDEVQDDFAAMLELAGDKPLIVQEAGYPVAGSLGSSEAAQADFVREVFAAWDGAGERIPFLSYFALGDFHPQMCSDFTDYYGLPNVQTFYDYLCSLGLHQVDGTPRAAWDVFAEEGRRRFGDGS